MAQEPFRLANPFRRVVSVQFAGGGPWDFYFAVLDPEELTLEEAQAIAADPGQLEQWAADHGFTVEQLEFFAGLLGITVPELMVLLASSGSAALFGAAKTGGRARVLSDLTVQAQSVASSYETPFALVKSGGQWKVVDPEQNVTRLRDGELDAKAAFDFFSVNATEWGVVAFAGEAGPVDDLMVTANTSTVITHDGTNTGFFPTQNNFFFADYNWNFGAPGDGRMRIYGASEESLIFDETGLELNPKIASTLHDVVFAMYGNDAGVQPLAPSFWSARSGLIGSPAAVPTYAGGTGVFYEIPHARAICTADHYYLFDFEFVEEHNELVPPQNVVVLGVTKVEAWEDEEGAMHHSVVRVPVTFNTEEEFQVTNDTSRLDILGVVATRDQAYMFFAICPPGGAESVFHLMLVDGDGNLTTLDTNFSLLRPGSSALQAFAAGASKDTPFLMVVRESVFGEARDALIYDNTGLIYTSEAGKFAAAPAVPTCIGNTNDNVFFKMNGAAGETFLVRNDGTTIDLEDPATWTGMAALPVTAIDTIYNVAIDTGANKLLHITQDGTTLEYSFGEYTIASVAVPVRSLIMGFQEFAAWGS